MFRIAMALFIGFAPIFYFMPSVQKQHPCFKMAILWTGNHPSVMLGVMAEISWIQ